MLALRAETRPFLILIRQVLDRRPDRQAALLLANLLALEEELAGGCVAVLEDARIRVGRLPIGGEE